MSAIIIKNMVNKEGYSSKWLILNDEIKKFIKNNILSTFNSSNIDIRKAADLAVVGICKVEIPQKQWLDIFQTLSNTFINENINIQLTYLNCLEYILEELNKSDIPSRTVISLLNTFYSLLSMEIIDESLCFYTLRAIKAFLPFIKEIVEKVNYREKFYDIVEKYTRNKSKNIRSASLKIFIDIVIILHFFPQSFLFFLIRQFVFLILPFFID